MAKPPRKPGSQVPPNLKVHVSDRPTARGHSKVPIEVVTAGKLYRVRDKNWTKVWGESLSWHEANKLKDRVCAQGKSRTARVEDMAVQPPVPYGQAGTVTIDPAIVAAHEAALAAVRPLIDPLKVPEKEKSVAQRMRDEEQALQDLGLVDDNGLTVGLSSGPTDDEIVEIEVEVEPESRCTKCRVPLDEGNRDPGAEQLDPRTQEMVTHPPWPGMCGHCAALARAAL